MKKYSRLFYLVAILALIMIALAPLSFTGTAQAQTSLPTAPQVAAQIKVGWNLGNTLEAVCGETAWGQPMATQQLIDSVKAAGFNSIRIPAAWDCHANQTTLVIDSAWMARVKQVVDYAINDGMYVVLNSHWDGGWRDEHPTFAAQASVKAKQQAYWTQIANTFKNYDQHLLFAGMNEVWPAGYSGSTPTSEHFTVFNSYQQAFVDAVRATGSNNATRTLVVQTFATNIALGISSLTMPTDSASNRLIVEVHYYDPWAFTGGATCQVWGAPYSPQGSCNVQQEAYVDDLFRQIKTKWVDAGIPVIIGEYGMGVRSGINIDSRLYYHRYVNQAATTNGIKTYYWDTGTLFNRNTGAIIDQSGVTAIMQGAGVVTGSTPTRTPTSITVVPTNTRTLTPAITNTRTPTRTPTIGASNTPSGPTATFTRTPTIGASPTRTNTPVGLTPTKTNTPVSGGACNPVTSTITAPFTFDGVGTFCWQSSQLGSYINSWNTTSVTINGVNATNVYIASGSYPAQIGGFWYIRYSSTVAWGHFETKP